MLIVKLNLKRKDFGFMINHDLKFIFMHIPKNAGTSLEKSLAKIQGTEDVSEMLQNKRVEAFKEFHNDTINKKFNDPAITVDIDDLQEAFLLFEITSANGTLPKT